MPIWLKEVTSSCNQKDCCTACYTPLSPPLSPPLSRVSPIKPAAPLLAPISQPHTFTMSCRRLACVARAGHAATDRPWWRLARPIAHRDRPDLGSLARQGCGGSICRRSSTMASSHTPLRPSSTPTDKSTAATSAAASLVPTDYVGLLHYLHSLNRNRGVRLGLSTMKTLLAALPSQFYTPSSYRIVHVAGSNGKGSVATKLAATLSAHRLTTAMYTSPHLSTWRERLTIDGQCISEQEVCELLPAVLQVATALELPLTAFEAQTALALCWFNVRGVDVAVLECGLGGRLDATNAVDHTLLAVITSISLEHTAILGPTTQHITREKAGILKRGQRAVVIGPTVDEAVVRQVASEVDGAGDIVKVTGHFDQTDAENVAVARAALAVLRADGGGISGKVRERAGGWDEAIIERAMTARPPCRYERLTLPTTPPLPVILDVGHNPAAFARLVAAVRADYPSERIRAVVGMSADKDIAACMVALLPHAHAVHLITAASPRSASLDQLHAAVSGTEQGAKVMPGNGDVREGVQAAVRECCAWNGRRSASEPQELLLVCGSFFIFRDVRPALGLLYPTDPIDLNESSLQPKGGQQPDAVATHTQHNSATPMRSVPASSSSSLSPYNLKLRLSTSHLPSASISSVPQQPSRSASSTSSPPAAPPRERTTKDLTFVPAGSDYHRACVQSLYRHMLTLARHFSSPLTVTPVADIRKEFRGAKECGLEEARERLRLGRGQLAYLRTQVERVYWRTGDCVGEKSELRRDHLVDDERQDESTAQHQSAGDAHMAEFKKGYDRIFASAAAEDGKKAAGQKDVQRWVYDEAGEALVEVSEEERKQLIERDGTVGGRRLSNSQGLTDEQYRRDRALKERFSFRGPKWKGRIPK